MTTNPYETPQWPPSGPSQPTAPPAGPGLVNQVRVVCILMIVQGVLELLAGLFFVGIGIFAGTMFEFAAANDPNFDRSDAPPGWLLGGIYAAMGLPGVIAGALHVYAGYRNYSFRGRTLGLVALIGGLASVTTCYCSLTSIGLAIYGLIVYMNAQVAAAFEMGQRGTDSNQILATFSPYHQRPPQA